MKCKHILYKNFNNTFTNILQPLYKYIYSENNRKTIDKHRRNEYNDLAYEV